MHVESQLVFVKNVSGEQFFYRDGFQVSGVNCSEMDVLSQAKKKTVRIHPQKLLI